MGITRCCIRCAHWHRRVLRGRLASVHAVLRPDRGRDRRATTHPPCLSFWPLLNGQMFIDYNAIRPGACKDKIAHYNSSRPGQECDSNNSSGNSCPRDAVFIFPLPGPEMEIAHGKSNFSKDFGCSSPAPPTKPRQYPRSKVQDACAQTHLSFIVGSAKISDVPYQLEDLSYAHEDVVGRLEPRMAADLTTYHPDVEELERRPLSAYR